MQTTALTQEQIDFYHENGYIGVENVLSADEVAELRRVTDEFVDQSRSVTEHTNIFDLEPSHTPENPRLRRIKLPITHHQTYRDTLHHAGICNIVSQLIGPNFRQNGNKLNLKLPEIGSPVEWHQDWAFYPHTNDDLLAVGVAIDEMTVENGCLLVIPGSHKGKIYDHHFEGHFAGAVTDSTLQADNPTQITLKAGGISIHHARMLHGSTPNHSQHPRRLLLFQYCALDAWPLLGVDWDTFNSEVVRGVPVNVPRVTDVPVRLPLPGAKRTGSIYETQTILQGSGLEMQ
ncbi:MAG: phytanoyl-CoA dioxygenase family protein [Chloroflexota bacterium]